MGLELSIFQILTALCFQTPDEGFWDFENKAWDNFAYQYLYLTKQGKKISILEHSIEAVGRPEVVPADASLT